MEDGKQKMAMSSVAETVLFQEDLELLKGS